MFQAFFCEIQAFVKLQESLIQRNLLFGIKIEQVWKYIATVT